ncbi:hypothetical protein Tco_1066870 [Tanacetum coccineum]|uniref:Uncharacterized protein n=1 Tax=Tanacetum coccineum TaxID=301880 RepID=A0ABQ5HBM6_9ASTR
MLEKHLYDSWKSRMELYMLNRPHGRMILASIEKGPLVWPSITEDGVTRLKEYIELTPAEAIQADYDIKLYKIYSPKAFQLKSMLLFVTDSQECFMANSFLGLAQMHSLRCLSEFYSSAQKMSMILSMFDQLINKCMNAPLLIRNIKVSNKAIDLPSLTDLKKRLRFEEMQNV